MASKKQRRWKQQLKREQEVAAPRPYDGHTPPAIPKPDTRALADRELHQRIGPVVPPTQEDDWYQ